MVVDFLSKYRTNSDIAAEALAYMMGNNVIICLLFSNNNIVAIFVELQFSYNL